MESQSAEIPPPPPGVYLVGTPIGNLEDITLRALRILAAADVLASEDTRVTRKLFQRHGLAAPRTLYACHDHNERAVAARLVKAAAEGKVAVFCSDAGMPAISDPGFNLARAAREAGVLLDVIPGPSAVATAVALPGIPAASFTFFGFPPRRDGKLRTLLAAHAGLAPAMIFYESPRRLARLLSTAAAIAGQERQAAVCLELTKKFQRVESGGLEELAQRFAAMETRGEATVIIAGRARGESFVPPAIPDHEDEDEGDDEKGIAGKDGNADHDD